MVGVETVLPKGWVELDVLRNDAAWAFVYDVLKFRPSISPASWPGILEPIDSETYSVGHVYGEPERYRTLALDLSERLVDALRSCCHDGEHILALDWQHSCYRFNPTSAFKYRSELDWPIPALPNGDYYIFLACDFRFGWFGHPWEQTICIFGERFLAALAIRPPALFDRLLRERGHLVPGFMPT
jgi:hypothetical protein